MIDLSSVAVAIVSGCKSYPNQAPYDPPESYPELPYASSLDVNNGVYGMVRLALRLLKMDFARFGTPDWNPLGEIVFPGDRVLIKPNFVLDRNWGAGRVEAVITHASVLRAIGDYVLIALKGRGELMIGDAPQMNCQWSKLLDANGIGPLSEHFEKVCANIGLRFTLKDFRSEETTVRYGVVWTRKALAPAVGRTIQVNLGEKSLMQQIDNRRLYGADYNRKQTVRAHWGRHEYSVAREVLEADVVISVPKLKVHSKVGTTLNLKNLVGINTDKNRLAHYRLGTRAQGGDEFSNPRWDDIVERWLSEILLGTTWRVGKYPFALWRAVRKVFRTVFPRDSETRVLGNWYGNDTAWRMALDLNRIVLTADRNGEMHETQQRRYFSFIDGIVGGQGEGPLKPDSYPSGVILAGANPLAVDWVATRLMGLDPERIPMYANGLEQMIEWVPQFVVSRISVFSNRANWEDLLDRADSIFQFRTPAGWRGKIELLSRQTASQPNLSVSRIAES